MIETLLSYQAGYKGTTYCHPLVMPI